MFKLAAQTQLTQVLNMAQHIQSMKTCPMSSASMAACAVWCYAI